MAIYELRSCMNEDGNVELFGTQAVLPRGICVELAMEIGFHGEKAGSLFRVQMIQKSKSNLCNKDGHFIEVEEITREAIFDAINSILEQTASMSKDDGLTFLSQKFWWEYSNHEPL